MQSSVCPTGKRVPSAVRHLMDLVAIGWGLTYRSLEHLQLETCLKLKDNSLSRLLPLCGTLVHLGLKGCRACKPRPLIISNASPPSLTCPLKVSTLWLSFDGGACLLPCRSQAEPLGSSGWAHERNNAIRCMAKPFISYDASAWHKGSSHDVGS